MKRIYRSKNDRRISGVCGGIAEYFDVDPTIIRIAWVIISVFSASVPGLLIYFLCAIIIPDEPDSYDTTAHYQDDSTEGNTHGGNTDFYYNEK